MTIYSLYETWKPLIFLHFILSKMNSLQPHKILHYWVGCCLAWNCLVNFYYPGIELKVCTELPRKGNFPRVFQYSLQENAISQRVFFFFTTAAPISQPEMPFLVTVVYYDMNKSFPDVKHTHTHTHVCHFQSFDTPLDSVALKFKKCIADTHTHTHTHTHRRTHRD